MRDAHGPVHTDLRPSHSLKSPILCSRRYFIQCSKSIPTRYCGINIDEFSKTLDQKGMYTLVQDTTMAPIILKKNTTTPAVKYIAWSPFVYEHKLRSLLSVITDSGSLDIYYLLRDSWVCGESVSTLWFTHCSSQWTDPPNETNEIMNELKSRTYKIKFSAFAWGSCLKKFWYDLFISSFDGTLSMWRVNQDFVTRAIEVKFVKEFLMEREIITALHCQYVPPHQYVIFLCYIDGRIVSVVIDVKEKEIKMSEINYLWDEKDKIQVYSGGLFSRMSYESSALSIITQAVKGRHVLIFNVNLDGSLKSYDVVITQELSVTGLASLSQKESLITGYSGSVYCLSLTDTEPSLTKIQDSLRTMHYACNGIAVSKSRCMAVLPYSVRSNYDHLTMKDLCHQIWCSIYNFSEANELFLKHPGPLSEIWDALEIMRIESILKGSGLRWNLPTGDFDTMDSINLKKHLALLQLSILLENIKGDLGTGDKVKIVREIQELLMSCHIFKKVSQLMTKTQLNDFEEQSLFLMKKWIDYILSTSSSKYNQTATVATTLKEQLDKLSLKCASEICTICSEEIPNITGFDIAECCSGHTLPRCSLSLVQCTDFPYYVCYKCNAIAHTKAVSEEDYSCIFCDNPLRLSEMVLSEQELHDAAIEPWTAIR